jgi:hypothetical protein
LATNVCTHPGDAFSAAFDFKCLLLKPLDVTTRWSVPAVAAALLEDAFELFELL